MHTCLQSLFHVTQWAKAEPPLLIKHGDKAGAALREPQCWTNHSGPRHIGAKSRPLLKSTQRSSPPATELCTFSFPADGSTWCQKKSRAHYKPQIGPCVSDSYLYTTQSMGFHLLPRNQVWGKKGARTFHLQVSLNNNLLKKTLKCK